MLSKSGIKLFKQLNISVQSLSELFSGVKLSSAINIIFYDNQNQAFENKIIKQNLDRKGNHIINANNILKQIKNDQNIQCPQQIRTMTSFTMIQNQGELNKLVNWLARQYQIRCHSKKIIREQNSNYEDDQLNASSMHHQLKQQERHEMYELHNNDSNEQNSPNYDTAFDNVFFCHKQLSPNGIETPPLHDSLEDSQKVVKRGSFKIIRPKQRFDGHIQNNYIEKQGDFEKQHIIIDADSEEKEQSARKTVPKISNRPPLYKKQNNNKELTKPQVRQLRDNIEFRSPAPFNSTKTEKQQVKQSPIKQNYVSTFGRQNHYGQSKSSQKLKNDTLTNELNDLQKQLQRQKRQSSQTNSRQKRSLSNTQRKLFKIDIPEICPQQKQLIVEWLISINILNTIAASYYDRLHEICKNGVIFPQIINHQKGRGKDLCYFKKPKRSAEIHSNYQKVFSYFQSLPIFQTQLLFMYEYFVPEAQQNAFWNLLLSCKKCFKKKIMRNSEQLYTRQSSIKTKMVRNQNVNTSRKTITSARKQSPKSCQRYNNRIEPQYQRIKYGSSSEYKRKSNEKQNKLETRKQSLEFINEMPEKKSIKKQDLVQKQEPLEWINKGSIGYRQLHEYKKNHSNVVTNMNTPQKKMTTDLSMSRSRIHSNSVKKLPKMQNPELPSVNLQMQMKAIKFLQDRKYINESQLQNSKSLFHDPIRNGTLANLIFKKQTKNQCHKYIIRPKNIDDCRQNFQKMFIGLKSSMIQIPNAYQYHYQQIIKGQMSLFYGLVWYLAYGSKIPLCVSKGQSLTLNNHSNINSNSLLLANQQVDSQNIIMWIQTIQKQSHSIARLQIRDINTLKLALTNSNLLYKLAEILIPEKYTVKPTYEHPINQIEQESNLKKILGFYAHNKIIKTDYVWKARSIVKKDKIIINNLMKNLMGYYIKKGTLNQEKNALSLAKYVKIQRQNLGDCLETTMANQSLIGINLPKQNQERRENKIEAKCSFIIQVQWMRKLGYIHDLALNNGVILCRLISQFTMQSIQFNENPHSKAECLTNIRKAIRKIQKFKWDQHQIYLADEQITYEVYKFLKEKYKHSYAMKYGN